MIVLFRGVQGASSKLKLIDLPTMSIDFFGPRAFWPALQLGQVLLERPSASFITGTRCRVISGSLPHLLFPNMLLPIGTSECYGRLFRSQIWPSTNTSELLFSRMHG